MTVREYVSTLSPSAKEVVIASRVSCATGLDYKQAVKELNRLVRDGDCRKENMIRCPECGISLRKGKIKPGESVTEICYGCDRDIALTYEDMWPVYNFNIVE